MNVLLKNMLMYIAPFWSSTRMRRLLAVISASSKPGTIPREKGDGSKAFVNVQNVLIFVHYVFFQKDTCQLFRFNFRPPETTLFFFILAVIETPNAAYTGVLFNRFWAQQLICWVRPKFTGKCWGKELQNGNEDRVRVNTATLCFVESTTGRNFFASWRQNIMFVMPQRQELKQYTQK